MKTIRKVKVYLDNQDRFYSMPTQAFDKDLEDILRKKLFELFDTKSKNRYNAVRLVILDFICQYRKQLEDIFEEIDILDSEGYEVVEKETPYILR